MHPGRECHAGPVVLVIEAGDILQARTTSAGRLGFLFDAEEHAAAHHSAGQLKARVEGFSPPQRSLAFAQHWCVVGDLHHCPACGR